MGQDFETIADVLPRRYRSVLDALDRLERSGARAAARKWRTAAIARYSRSWDAATLRWLEETSTRVRAFETERQAALARSDGKADRAA